MPQKDCQTEKKILNAAMKTFFEDGRLNATTQEIADAAGVNRTLIHYYFRSKKELMNSLLKDAKIKFTGNNDKILSSGLPFRKKTEAFVDEFLKSQFRYPYLEPFLTMNLIQERFNINSPKNPRKQPQAIKQHLQEVEHEWKEGRIRAYSPDHFMLNLFSMIVYPFLTKQLQMNMLDADEEKYEQLLKERKKVIMETLLPESV
ncbi:MAG: TetR/AcrR family transcriptional regulator [Saccharofermentanaceae bacterium]|jgi:AcrR family transcriptional regulator